uniref:Uncharacterized protein n=1 Tax=Tanacetum cinerariifolium TaxID=118510 RepID=A0A6L2N6G3_TANCI|nr:hypothetical protein [Tanacetum cinerariifolium]
MFEDTTSVTNHYLGGMVLGKPFVKESKLVYDKDEGTIMFEKDNEKITFKMPHKMKRFKHIDIEDLKTDNIPLFGISSDDSDQEKTYYLGSLNLGPEYKQDESVTKAIHCLIEMKNFSKKRRKLYLHFMETVSGILPDGVATPAIENFDIFYKETSDVLSIFMWTILG